MIDASVLVLNSLYQAVQITGTQRAFRLFYAGRARALSPDFTSYDFDTRPSAAGAWARFGSSCRSPGAASTCARLHMEACCDA